MKASSWDSLAFILALAVAVVVAVAAMVVEGEPKLSCCISICVIAVCIATLTQTLPIALHPLAMVTVICQVTHTASPTIIIHNSITQTIQGGATIVNSTTTEIASKVSCP